MPKPYERESEMTNEQAKIIGDSIGEAIASRMGTFFAEKIGLGIIKQLLDDVFSYNGSKSEKLTKMLGTAIGQAMKSN